MKGKGKLIAKVGAVAFLLEDVGDGEYFKVAFINEQGEVVATTDISLVDAVWLTKCIDRCVTVLFDENIRNQWFAEDEDGD